MTPEAKKAYMAEYRRRNRDRLRSQSAEYYQANKTSILERMAGHYRENRERVRAAQQERYRANRAEYVERASRRQRELEQHPSWDAELDDLVIAEAYELAQQRQAACPLDGGWHVDHTVPLRHRNACGLHNAWNVQVVPAKWNLAKGNRSMAKFWPTADPWAKYARPKLTARARRATA